MIASSRANGIVRNRVAGSAWVTALAVALWCSGCVKEYDDFVEAGPLADAVEATGQDLGFDLGVPEVAPDAIPPEDKVEQTGPELEPETFDAVELAVDLADDLELTPELEETEDTKEAEAGCVPVGEGDDFGDSIDQNCDGLDGVDGDGDGFAANADGIVALPDCDDSAKEIHPGAEDPVDGLGVDSNCDGMDGVDGDGDGYATEKVGTVAADCDDANADVHPGAEDFVQGACSDVQMAALTDVVDEEGNVGYYSSAAIGADGTLYVAYRKAEEGQEPAAVKVAVRAPGAEQWTHYTVTENSGQYIDMALANDTLHVTYYDKGACKCLKYAHAAITNLGAGQWTEAVVDDDATSEVGRYSSVEIGKDGVVHVAYWDSKNDDLKYATNATGQFVAQAISGEDVVGGEEEKIGSFTSMALDKDGHAHIATYFATGSSLAYLTNTTGSWEREIVDDDGWDVGKYASLALDSNGAAHVAYRYSSLEDLRYATNATGTWKTETVDGATLKVGSYTAIAVDQENKVHIAYNQGDLDYLRYATNRPGYWVAKTAYSDQKSGLQNAIAIGQDGAAHIFTGHNATKKLFHTTAMLDCLGLESAYLDADCDGTDGIDFDGDGYASVDSGGDDCNDQDETVQPQWVTTVLDPGPSVGKYASLAIDAHNNLHASYYAELPKHLMYARLVPGGEWEILSADETGQDVGQYSAIAVQTLTSDQVAAGTQAAVHIAYYDAFHGELWYATNESGAWVPSVVEATETPGDDVGKYAAIAIDADTKSPQSPHVAYYDSTHGLLRYGTKASGLWELFTVPNVGNAGKHAAMAVRSGTAYVAYQAVDTYDLMVAVGKADTWNVQLVDGPTKDMGEALSIAVDSSKRVHVSYRDTNDSYLHYAVKEGDVWSTVAVDADSSVGKWSALALDGNDRVHIAYKDQGSNAFRYATNVIVENYVWWKEEITSKPKEGEAAKPCGGLTTECGDYSTLRFDPMGSLNAIHYDSLNKQLLYSRKSCLGF